MLEEFLEDDRERLEASLFEISLFDLIEDLLGDYESLKRYAQALSQFTGRSMSTELSSIKNELSSLMEKLSKEEILFTQTIDPSVVSPILKNRYLPAISEISKKIREVKVMMSSELEVIINTILEIAKYCDDDTTLISFLSAQLRSMLEKAELIPPELLVSAAELLVKHIPQESSLERVMKEIENIKVALQEFSTDLSEHNKERMRDSLETLNRVEFVVRRFPNLSGAAIKYLDDLKNFLLSEMMKGLSGS